MGKIWGGVAPVYTGVICFFSLTDNIAPSLPFTYIDKAYHAGAYFIMLLLWYFFFYQRYLSKHPQFEWNTTFLLKKYSKTIALGAGAICFIIGVLVELGQGYFAKNRTMDLFDVIANSAGIILAIGVLWFISKRFNIEKT